MPRFITSVILHAAFAMLLLNTSARALNFHVGSNQEYESIQAAIIESQNGDTIIVDPGTYYEAIRFMGKEIVLCSRFLSTNDTGYISETIIDGCQRGSAVEFTEGGNKAALIGFTITNGAGSPRGDPNRKRAVGGGILCENASPLLSHLVLTGHSARLGYALYCAGKSNPILRQVSLHQDGIDFDSDCGIEAEEGCYPYLESVTIWDHSPVWNGGLFHGVNDPTFVRIRHCDYGRFQNWIKTTHSSDSTSLKARKRRQDSRRTAAILTGLGPLSMGIGSVGSILQYGGNLDAKSSIPSYFVLSAPALYLLGNLFKYQNLRADRTLLGEKGLNTDEPLKLSYPVWVGVGANTGYSLSMIDFSAGVKLGEKVGLFGEVFPTRRFVDGFDEMVWREFAVPFSLGIEYHAGSKTHYRPIFGTSLRFSRRMYNRGIVDSRYEGMYEDAYAYYGTFRVGILKRVEKRYGVEASLGLNFQNAIPSGRDAIRYIRRMNPSTRGLVRGGFVEEFISLEAIFFCLRSRIIVKAK